MNSVKTFVAKYWITALGGVVGGIAGYIYWLNWACTTGCPLTATPTRTVLYGAVLVGLIFSMFPNRNK